MVPKHENERIVAGQIALFISLIDRMRMRAYLAARVIGDVGLSFLWGTQFAEPMRVRWGA